MAFKKDTIKPILIRDTKYATKIFYIDVDSIKELLSKNKLDISIEKSNLKFLEKILEHKKLPFYYWSTSDKNTIHYYGLNEKLEYVKNNYQFKPTFIENFFEEQLQRYKQYYLLNSL